MIFFDTETTGLDPRHDRLVVVGIAVDDGDVIVLRHPDDRELVQAALDVETTYVAHNVNFDMAFLEHAGYRIPPAERWLDTVLVAHIAGERKAGQTALKRLAKNMIDAGELPPTTLEPEQRMDAWLKQAQRRATKQGQPKPQKGHAPRELLHPYLRADIVETRAAAAYYGARLSGQSAIARLERECLPAIYAAMRRGVPVDQFAAVALQERTARALLDARAAAHALAGRPFSLTSPKQIKQALLDRGADLSVLPRTPKTQEPSFSEQNLVLLDDDLARAITTFRATKKTADYAKKLLAGHRGRLYSSIHQFGTDTGRMSCSQPNLMALPKTDLSVRYVLRAPEGRVFVAADLDAVEMRVLACYAPGGALEQAFRDGVDLHRQTGEALGLTRDEGKTINYAIQYGAGIPRVSQSLGISPDEAKQVLDRWYRTYPEVGALKDRLRRKVRQRGYITTIGGRRHYFEQPNHMVLNRLIQGGSADLFKAAIARLHTLDVPMIMFIHDEVLCEVPEEDADRVARLLETELTRPAERPGVLIDGLVAEAEIAERWSDFKQPGWAPEPVAPAEPQLELATGEGQ